jgi:hypothetical protein
MPNSDSDSREIAPRNMVWVEDMPPNPAKNLPGNFTGDDYNNLKVSHYTHAIICFFHLDPGPTLVYNLTGNKEMPDYNEWWGFLRTLNKTLMLSVGGWNSGTWANAQGYEEDGAGKIVEFAQNAGFAGIDFKWRACLCLSGRMALLQKTKAMESPHSSRVSYAAACLEAISEAWKLI